MGRFFPHADLTDIVAQHEARRQRELQRDLHVPRGRRHRVREGARQRGARRTAIALDEALVAVDLERKVAHDDDARDPLRAPRLERAVRPLRRALRLDARPGGVGLEQGARLQPRLRREGPSAASTGCYYPSRDTSFYRVGWYDNIFDTDRLSLYVEIGFPKDARHRRRSAMRARVLARPRARGRRRPASASSPSTRSCSTRPTSTSRAPRWPSTQRLSRLLARARRLVDRPLRRLDLLLHRGQHRRSARPRGELELAPHFVYVEAPTVAAVERPRTVARPEPADPHISIVIPIYNEQAILHAAVVDLRERLKPLGWSYEIILAENGSKDRTDRDRPRARREVRRPERRAGRRSSRMGEPNYGKALKQGILLARGDLVLCDEIDLCDTDFHKRAVDILETGEADLVIGSKLAVGAGRRAAPHPPRGEHRLLDAAQGACSASAGPTRTASRRSAASRSSTPCAPASSTRTSSPASSSSAPTAAASTIKEIPVQRHREAPAEHQPLQARPQRDEERRQAHLVHPHPRVTRTSCSLRRACSHAHPLRRRRRRHGARDAEQGRLRAPRRARARGEDRRQRARPRLPREELPRRRRDQGAHASATSTTAWTATARSRATSSPRPGMLAANVERLLRQGRPLRARRRHQRLRLVRLPLRQAPRPAGPLDRQPADHQPLQARQVRQGGREGRLPDDQGVRARQAPRAATTTSSRRSSTRPSATSSRRTRRSSRRSCGSRSSTRRSGPLGRPRARLPDVDERHEARRRARTASRGEKFIVYGLRKNAHARQLHAQGVQRGRLRRGPRERARRSSATAASRSSARPSTSASPSSASRCSNQYEQVHERALPRGARLRPRAPRRIDADALAPLPRRGAEVRGARRQAQAGRQPRALRRRRPRARALRPEGSKRTRDTTR